MVLKMLYSTWGGFVTNLSPHQCPAPTRVIHGSHFGTEHPPHISCFREDRILLCHVELEDDSVARLREMDLQIWSRTHSPAPAPAPSPTLQ